MGVPQGAIHQCEPKGYRHKRVRERFHPGRPHLLLARSCLLLLTLTNGFSHLLALTSGPRALSSPIGLLRIVIAIIIVHRILRLHGACETPVHVVSALLGLAHFLERTLFALLALALLLCLVLAYLWHLALLLWILSRCTRHPKEEEERDDHGQQEDHSCHQGFRRILSHDELHVPSHTHAA